MILKIITAERTLFLSFPVLCLENFQCQLSYIYFHILTRLKMYILSKYEVVLGEYEKGKNQIIFSAIS